jgi:hypothetical protein
MKNYEVVGPNDRWESKVEYDALYLGPTHYFVQNRSDSRAYLNDEQLRKGRPEPRLVETVLVATYPNEQNIPRIKGPKIVKPKIDLESEGSVLGS